MRIILALLMAASFSANAQYIGGGNGGDGCRVDCDPGGGTGGGGGISPGGGTGGDIRPGGGTGGGGSNNPPDEALLEFTRRPMITRLGCAGCDDPQADIVPVLAGYYQGTSVLLGVSPQAAQLDEAQRPDTAAVAISPNGREAMSVSTPIPAADEINDLLADSQPFSRPGVVKTIRDW